MEEHPYVYLATLVSDLRAVATSQQPRACAGAGGAHGDVMAAAAATSSGAARQGAALRGPHGTQARATHAHIGLFPFLK